MRTLTKAKAVLVAVGLSVAGVAAAQPGGEHGEGMGPGKGACARDHGKAFGARLDTLKSELKLTGPQTAAWDAYEKAVRAQGEAMKTAHQQTRDIADSNARMDARIATMEQRVAGMKAVAQARKQLYDTLTPEQKAIADRYSNHGGRHGRHA